MIKIVDPIEYLNPKSLIFYRSRWAVLPIKYPFWVFLLGQHRTALFDYSELLFKFSKQNIILSSIIIRM
jgi:hypothetical protein